MVDARALVRPLGDLGRECRKEFVRGPLRLRTQVAPDRGHVHVCVLGPPRTAIASACRAGEFRDRLHPAARRLTQRRHLVGRHGRRFVGRSANDGFHVLEEPAPPLFGKDRDRSIIGGKHGPGQRVGILEAQGTGDLGMPGARRSLGRLGFFPATLRNPLQHVCASARSAIAYPVAHLLVHGQRAITDSA